jgi:hypothetical protein
MQEPWRRHRLSSGVVRVLGSDDIFKLFHQNLGGPERAQATEERAATRGMGNAGGWLEGLRPSSVAEQNRFKENAPEADGNGQQNGNRTARNGDVVRQIGEMERVVGKRMYRGLLKSIARVWNPNEIRNGAVQQRVLAQMQAAERGLLREKAAREKAGLASFAAVLGSLKLSSLEQVDNLKTLQEIVIALEGATKPTIR